MGKHKTPDAMADSIQTIECIKGTTSLMKLQNRLMNPGRLAGIRHLTAGTAHNIKNSLSNIKAVAQFCLDRYEIDEPLRKSLKVIVKNSKKANRTVNVLLNLARPHETALAPGTVNRVVHRAYNLVKPIFLKQGVRLSKRLHRKLPMVLLDEDLLEEAFLNFILNAIDAMPRRGRLSITAYHDPKSAEVVVSFVDSGCGIPNDNLKKIFTPFFTTKKDGTGLGLTLAKHIIELHSGTLQVESKPGYGTEVTVSLPIHIGKRTGR
ncbi:MAG: ATP-binding protein [Thermodesulfovibrionales bacterium]|nr:ATP-binding protein [Thermodesulfovibrionales bacterium]